MPGEQGKWNLGESHQLIMLLSLVAVLMIVPIFEHFVIDRIAMQFGITLILIAAVFATRRKKHLFVPCVFVALLATPITWTTLFVDHTAIFVISCIVESVFFFFLAIGIMIRVLRKHVATVDSIFGSICVYLLLGLAFALLYWATERVNSEAFDMNRVTVTHIISQQETTSFSQFVYFSFVTMTTLGFGDIVPVSPISQTLTWMQAAVGQFYIAILVARIVSLVPLQAVAVREEEAETKKDPAPE